MARASVSVLMLAAALGGAGSTAAARVPPRPPSASAAAAAIRVVESGGGGVTSPQPGATGGSQALPSFSYPRDGAVVLSGASDASTARRLGAVAASSATATVSDLSIFDGEITADAVSVRASATSAGATGGSAAATIVHLQALGLPITRGSVALGSWGTLTVAARAVDRAAPHGAKAYRGSLTGVLVSLARAHGGLPAGSLIEIAVVQATAATAPPPPPRSRPAPPQLVPADRPQLLPAPSGPLIGVPQVIEPALGPNAYVFPVFGRSSYTDDYGSLAPGVDYLHGIDIFGQLGQPLVAVASGTLFAVGWTRAQGDRLWLRDGQGNEFSYAHLSAFASTAVRGAHVSAGQVIGFMGDTGAPSGAPAQLEFEVHPVSMLYLGPQGAVDPAPYLAGWRRVASVSLEPGTGWSPSVRVTATAPQPGAVLVSSSDIAAVAGPDPSALRRALAPRARG